MRFVALFVFILGTLAFADGQVKVGKLTVIEQIGRDEFVYFGELNQLLNPLARAVTSDPGSGSTLKATRSSHPVLAKGVSIRDVVDLEWTVNGTTHRFPGYVIFEGETGEGAHGLWSKRTYDPLFMIAMFHRPVPNGTIADFTEKVLAERELLPFALEDRWVIERFRQLAARRTVCGPAIVHDELLATAALQALEVVLRAASR